MALSKEKEVGEMKRQKPDLAISQLDDLFDQFLPKLESYTEELGRTFVASTKSNWDGSTREYFIPENDALAWDIYWLLNTIDELRWELLFGYSKRAVELGIKLGTRLGRIEISISPDEKIRAVPGRKKGFRSKKRDFFMGLKDAESIKSLSEDVQISESTAWRYLKEMAFERLNFEDPDEVFRSLRFVRKGKRDQWLMEFEQTNGR